jgi:acetoin utilization protein AcuB
VSALPIAALMRPAPVSIRPDAPLAVAHQTMREHHVRFLVVVDGEQLVGLLSLDDLHLIESLGDVDPRRVPIDDAMVGDVFVVDPAAPAAEVVAGMLERDIDAAVVADGGRIEGIFTVRDALSALVHLLGPVTPRPSPAHRS